MNTYHRWSPAGGSGVRGLGKRSEHIVAASPPTKPPNQPPSHPLSPTFLTFLRTEHRCVAANAVKQM